MRGAENRRDPLRRTKALGPRAAGPTRHYLALRTMSKIGQPISALQACSSAVSFARDAYLNDNRREIRGTAAIRASSAKEFVGDPVTWQVGENLQPLQRHHCPCPRRQVQEDQPSGPLIMTSYLGVNDDKITSLAVVVVQPNRTSPVDRPWTRRASDPPFERARRGGRARTQPEEPAVLGATARRGLSEPSGCTSQLRRSRPARA